MDTLTTPLQYELSSAKVMAFLENYPEGVVFLDHDGKILFFNKGAQTIFGCSEQAVAGNTLESLIVPELREAFTKQLIKLISKKDAVVSGQKFESRGIKQDGTEATIEISQHMIREGDKQFIFCIVEDISEQLALQQQLYQQTITDPLTGMYNRRYFDDRIRQEFGRANRYQRIFSVVIIDIDGFKYANDIYGHAFGDDLLIRIRDVFAQVLRDGDTVYRWRG